jgi:LacI family transcriptional regulator
MPRSTIFHVADRAGVSIKTVSRVVNQQPNVRKETRERVEQAIAELKYRPDQSARNLAGNRSHLIGLVYDDPSAYDLPSGGYILELQHGALRACRSALCELLIHPCDFRKRNVAAELKSVIEHARLSGVIVAPPLSNMPRIIRAVEATGAPFVRLSPGSRAGKHSSVATNDREISAELTRYVAQLGHERIAYIAGNPQHKAVANRLLGYQDGLRESGLQFSERLVVNGDNSFGSGVAGAERLLKRRNRPTAIIAANDDMAVGAMRVAHRLGMDVPSQLSIAGFDDIALARQVEPALTTVRQPLVRMAERAALMLINSNNGNGTMIGHECVPATLKLRDSTGPASESTH